MSETKYQPGIRHPWTGGACPLDPDVTVMYWMGADRDPEGPIRAGNLDWSHATYLSANGAHITAFKVVNEPIRSDTERMIRVMRAYTRGEPIEMRYISASPEEWLPIEAPVWNWAAIEYRVKR